MQKLKCPLCNGEFTLSDEIDSKLLKFCPLCGMDVAGRMIANGVEGINQIQNIDNSVLQVEISLPKYLEETQSFPVLPENMSPGIEFEKIKPPPADVALSKPQVVPVTEGEAKFQEAQPLSVEQEPSEEMPVEAPVQNTPSPLIQFHRLNSAQEPQLPSADETLINMPAPLEPAVQSGFPEPQPLDEEQLQIDVVMPEEKPVESDFPLPQRQEPVAIASEGAQPTEIAEADILKPPSHTSPPPMVVADAEIIDDIAEDAEHLKASARPSTDTSYSVLPPPPIEISAPKVKHKSPFSMIAVIVAVGVIAGLVGLSVVFSDKGTEHDAVSPVKLHFAYGNKMMEEKNFDAAIEEYRQVLQYDPNFAEAWRSLGVAYTHKGNVEEAKKAYEKFLQIAPTHPEAAKIRSMLGK